MTITDRPTPILNAHQPCKPRQAMTEADKRPMVYRPGSLDATALPRIHGGWRIWPDGHKEKL